MSEANIWSFVLAALGIAGLLLAGSKRKVGWLVGFAIQPLWIVFAIRTGQYGFVINALAYAAVYGRNWLAWRKDEAKVKWDGKHRLLYVINEEYFGGQPREYLSGWTWKCSCGTGTALPLKYAYTEEQAAREFVGHTKLHSELAREVS